MLEGPDREQAPLRWRLYSTMSGFDSMPTLTESIEMEESHASMESEYVHPAASLPEVPTDIAPTVAAPEPIAAPVPVAAPEPAATDAPADVPGWKTHLDRAMAQSEERMAHWIADQRRQVTDGLDALVADLRERRQHEVTEIETWRRSEHTRVEKEFAAEEERFRERLMSELRSFEEQLGLRLQEQEERIARWWDEAERLSQERFASLRADSANSPATN